MNNPINNPFLDVAHEIESLASNLKKYNALIATAIKDFEEAVNPMEPVSKPEPEGPTPEPAPPKKKARKKRAKKKATTMNDTGDLVNVDTTEPLMVDPLVAAGNVQQQVAADQQNSVLMMEKETTYGETPSDIITPISPGISVDGVTITSAIINPELKPLTKIQAMHRIREISENLPDTNAVMNFMQNRFNKSSLSEFAEGEYALLVKELEQHFTPDSPDANEPWL